jgi:hypothetical protein
MPKDAPRTQLSLPPLAWAAIFGAGLLLVLMVAGIATQVVILQDSRNHIRAQDAKLALALSTAREAAPEARQAARDVLPLLDDARPVIRKVSRAIGPLAQSGDELAIATENLPRLIRTSQALATVVLPVLDRLSILADAALYRARLVHALDSTNEMLDRVRSEDLIRLSARAAREAPHIVRLQRRTVRVQLASLKTQRDQLRAQLETLAIQREALVHIRSIDRKSGPPPPATPVTP